MEDDFNAEQLFMFRLQKEMSACPCAHVVSERRQVGSRDEIVILLHDRLRRERLKKEAKREGRNPTGGTKGWEKAKRWQQM